MPSIASFFLHFFDKIYISSFPIRYIVIKPIYVLINSISIIRNSTIAAYITIIDVTIDISISSLVMIIGLRIARRLF